MIQNLPTAARTRAPSFARPFMAALLAIAFGATAAAAQPAADRAAMDAKKKEADDKRKQREELKKAKAKETSQQREERLRTEKKQANAQAALTKAQGAIDAANRRKNKQAYDMMREAWHLDPENRDYAFLTGQLAAGNKDEQGEFAAYAAYLVIVAKLVGQLGPGESDFKTALLNRKAQAEERLHVLRNTITTGKVQIATMPAICEMYLDGAYVGVGDGTIEAIAGQHKLKADCPGHYPIDQFLNVRAGDANRHLLRPTPIPYFGSLVINVKPADDVTIFLDDVPIENRMAAAADKDGKITGKGTKLDPIRLHARKWIIRFKKAGYDRWHRRITIERDSMFVVNAALERMEDNVESTGK